MKRAYTELFNLNFKPLGINPLSFKNLGNVFGPLSVCALFRMHLSNFV